MRHGTSGAAVHAGAAVGASVRVMEAGGAGTDAHLGASARTCPVCTGGISGGVAFDISGGVMFDMAACAGDGMADGTDGRGDTIP